MRRGFRFHNVFCGLAAAYAAAQACAYLAVNAAVTGLYSDLALGFSLLAAFVCVGALMFGWSRRRITLGSPATLAWTLGLWLLIVLRLVLAYRLNRVSTGLASVTSCAWLAASLGMGGLSAADLRAEPDDHPASSHEPGAPAATGRTLGKYQVRGLLGRGAMGAVHDGWDPVIARRVAIKTIPLPPPEDPQATELLARFRREAQAAGRLLHPNIVGVFDYGETEDCAYIVMEFVAGSSLGAALESRRHLPPAEALSIMADVLAGLQYSHERGVVHRDIKPANIMLSREGHAKIADFGIARLDGGSMVTEVGKVLGTAAYMSPEQFLGEPVDARSDIFSAGVLLYRLLTGERPFAGGLTTIMHQVLSADPLPPSQRRASVPPAFDRVAARAMAKRREDRYPSAAAFAQAIRAAAAAGADAIEPTVLGAARAD